MEVPVYAAALKPRKGAEEVEKSRVKGVEEEKVKRRELALKETEMAKRAERWAASSEWVKTPSKETGAELKRKE